MTSPVYNPTQSFGIMGNGGAQPSFMNINPWQYQAPARVPLQGAQNVQQQPLQYQPPIRPPLAAAVNNPAYALPNQQNVTRLYGSRDPFSTEGKAVAAGQRGFGIMGGNSQPTFMQNQGGGFQPSYGGGFQPFQGNGNLNTANQFNAQMSGYFDTAMQENRANFKQGLNVLGGQMNDPRMSQLIQQSMSRAGNPGLSQSVINQMKGQMFQGNVANQNSNMRQTMGRMGGSGVSGAAQAYMASMIRNQSANAASRGAANIDIEAAKFAKGDEASATSQAAGLLGQKNGMAAMFANYLKSYNPLDQMQQIQQMQQPFTQIGYGLGRQGMA
jgi:hypothetical protein